MKSEDMNEGIRLLLERMKTNPEEFEIEDGALYSSSKWGKLVHDALRDEVFSEEERSAVQEAFRQVRRNNFTSDVLRALTVEETPVIKAEWSKLLHSGTITATQSQYNQELAQVMLNNPYQQRK
jgi:hypothetical protein